MPSPFSPSHPPPRPPRSHQAPSGRQADIPSSDGVTLHADVLRPSHLPANAKTPVIISIGPYFNHSGQVGPAGPVQDATYDPVGPTVGPSDRFNDLVQGAKLMQRGYTFVMVDIRGFGGSNGCLDWGGPGEQSDVVSAVNWAAKQGWSNGRVGMYGKSYDGVTGLVGVNKRPAGLKAVVAQEPVYDLYRYLYGDGIRRLNSGATPALYNLIALTPGPATGNPIYNVNGADDVQRPGCSVQNQMDQTSDDNHGSPYWLPRNLIPGAKGSNVPLFLTQGLTENNTVADGLAQYMRNHTGYQRSWLGPWEHVRGAETCKENDISTGCTDSNVGRLKMGRAGFYDEVIRFYDRFLKGASPKTQDPRHALQTNDGIWRAESSWPPSDSNGLNSPFRKGEYTDDADGSATGTEVAGVWTISKPLPHAAHLAGSGRATVNVSTPVPNSNVVVDVYDLNSKGVGPLVSRQGHLIRQSGTIGMDLWSMDWKFAKGHRVAMRVTDANPDWWVHTAGGQPVTLSGGSFTLPWLRYTRPGRIAGAPGVQLPEYLKETITVPQSLIRSSESSSFRLPPRQVDSPRFGIRARCGRKYGLSRNGRSFRVRCTASGTGRRRAVLGAHWKPRGRKFRRIGRGGRVFPAGKRSILVRVRLNKTGRRLLKRRPRGTRIRINARATDQIGQIAKHRQRVKLRMKRR